MSEQSEGQARSPWLERMADDETPERRAEVRRLASALRSVIERFVATTAPLEVFQGVADELEAIAGRLGKYPQEHLYMGFAEAANAGDSEGPFDHSPLMGLSNPLAPPLLLEVQADRVIGTVTCGSAYEGPPGHVHGGFIAAMFDDLLGMTQSLSGKNGMTGRLTVHYRSPTPLHTELRLEGTLDRTSGRKILCSGQLFHGDVLCAEAEGLFITIDFERLVAMHEEREAGFGR
ncbi:MAG TPA: PaaI family thioesterase [Acidimicrobiales bacterium]|jgi:acyl-coenzyme A thioesterase PaaI-like protein